MHGEEKSSLQCQVKNWSAVLTTSDYYCGCRWRATQECASTLPPAMRGKLPEYTRCCLMSSQTPCTCPCPLKLKSIKAGCTEHQFCNMGHMSGLSLPTVLAKSIICQLSGRMHALYCSCPSPAAAYSDPFSIIHLSCLITTPEQLIYA